ncbi:MAG: CapA family protein [Actinomycetota bacterium]|nr:CapA family protein [Actinomycetota bacterium]
MKWEGSFSKASVFFTALAFVLISAGSLSCRIDFSEINTSPEVEEEADSDVESESTNGEETGEIEKEINPVRLWIDEAVPADMSIKVRSELIGAFDEVKIVDKKEDSNISVEVGCPLLEPAAVCTYVPVVSFFRAFDNLSYDELVDFWEGDGQSLNYMSPENSGPQLVLTGEVFRVLEEILGECKNERIEIVDEEELLPYIENENSFSIVPFENIEKKFKVLNLDGMSVFDKEIDINDYPLAFGINVEGDGPEIEEKISECFNGELITNRDTEKMSSVIMTGVTAMVRGTANRMERYGPLYPAEEIAGILRDADITHISNEVPFVESCDVSVDRFPLFCSKPEYIELLEYVGTDVVELTGNHMNDYGHDWFIYTLDMYDDEGWPYYGGGRNLEESYNPAVLESDGNRFAFLGFNWWGPAYDWAAEDTPGSAPPNFEDFEGIIKDLKNEGYIVIFTFQYLESYQYSPTNSQIEDFRRMIDAGADIVSGSQSHWPMGIEFRGDGFINYGLGNLFFDQMKQLGTRQGIIAKHIFYEGQHINTVIITTMLEDYSQPVPAAPEEREEILNSIFEGSIR